MRVHAVIDGLASGGAQALLAEFARAAPAAGIDLTVTSMHVLYQAPVVERLRELGVPPGSLQMPDRIPLGLFAAARRRLAAVPTDIVHTHLGIADTFGLTAARTLRLPAVSTIHSMEWPANGRNEKIKLHAASWARRHGDQVIAVSDSAKANYVFAGWDRADHVTVVRNGIALRPAPGAGRAIRSELGIPAGVPVIGMLSPLRAGKGHEIAAAAFADIRGSYRAARLVVIGDGPHEPAVREALAPLGDGAVMTGHRDDVMELLDAFDVLIHPSHAEALPTALMEAMAAGTPVVATDVGGVPEVVQDGVDGTLIPAPPRTETLGRAVLGLLDDPGHAGALAARARESVATRFGAERWLRETREVYEHTIAARRSRRSR